MSIKLLLKLSKVAMLTAGWLAVCCFGVPIDGTNTNRKKALKDREKTYSDSEQFVHMLYNMCSIKSAKRKKCKKWTLIIPADTPIRLLLQQCSHLTITALSI